MENDYIISFKNELCRINYSTNTISSYTNVVNLFLIHFKKHPKQIVEQEIKDYILNYKSSNTKKQQIGALKLFYKLVVKQPLKFKYIEYPRKEHKLPVILSVDEMKRLISVIKNKKHKAIVCLLYSCGLRISELINLKISDIDKDRKIIRIIGAKGHKDRIVPFNNSLRNILVDYYIDQRPVEYLFNGQFDAKYSVTSIRQFLNKYAKQASIKKDIYPHLLRHCCFSHMIESGVDISIVQEIAGHNNQKTTDIYKHLSNKFIGNISTPLNLIS